MISKVISGGQNGVDLAALRAAKTLQVPTGGTMPQGWITLDGPRPEYASEYHMVECDRPGYPPRTERNVADADFTLRIARYFNSPGEKCTFSAIREHKKPYGDILINSAWEVLPSDTDAVICALRARSTSLGRAIVLNVAGNSERTCHGIGDLAFDVVRNVLGTLLGKGKIQWTT